MKIVIFEKSWCNANEWIVQMSDGNYLNVRKNRKEYRIESVYPVSDDLKDKLIDMAKAMPICPKCNGKKCKCTV